MPEPTERVKVRYIGPPVYDDDGRLVARGVVPGVPNADHEATPERARETVEKWPDHFELADMPRRERRKASSRKEGD